MKKINLILLVTTIFFFSACNLQIPEKISVKTNAEYKLCAGSVKQSLDEDIKVRDIINNDSIGIPNAQVYDYFPSEKNVNVQQFLLKLPLMEIPVDIGQYYKNSGISTAVQGMSFEKEITIPTVGVNTKKEIDTQQLNNGLNAMFSFSGITGTGGVSFAGDFESVTYSSGYIVITVADSIPDGTNVNVNGRSGTFSGNTAEVNIAGFTLRKDSVNVTFSDGHGKGFIGTIKDGSQISSASGVTYSGLNIPVTTSFVLPNNFVSAVVNEGTLKTSVSIPWSGTSVSYTVTTSGGMNVSGSGDINLSDKTITPGTVNVSAPLTVSFSNATIQFSKKASVTITTEIASFKEVVINASDIDTSMNKTENFTADVYQSVKEIMLIPSGLKGTYTNTLPAGNNIQVVASSDFFGISNGSTTLEPGQTDASFNPIMSPSDFRKAVIPVEPAQHNPSASKYSGWDFAMNIKFPGNDGNANHISIKNVKPSEKYKIAMDFAPELNWEYIKIQPPNSNNADVKSLGINFAKLFGSMTDTLGFEFGTKAELVSVPLYIRAEKPSIPGAFDNLMFTGRLDLFYADKNGTKIKKDGKDIQQSVLGNASTMKFVEGISEYKVKKGSLITDISQYEASKKDNLAGLINQTLYDDTGELYIDYDIALTGAGNAIKITKQQCESSASGSIAVIALIDMPLKFRVISGEEPIVMDVGSFMGNDSGKDLFGRTAKEPVSGLGEQSDVIESCGFEYETKQAPFYSDPDMQLQLEILPGEVKTKNFKSGEAIVSTSGITKMFSAESYPYSPKISLCVPPRAEFSIPREMKLEMKITLVINTNGTIDVMGGN